MFWIASDLGCGNINVVCNGITRTISSVYGSAPSCGASGTATFDLSPGTYAFTASCSGKNWSGNITVTAGNCSKLQLTSSGGGGGGGGGSTGQGMFWIASDLGCGNITVVCNGITRTISTIYATSPPCGTSGTATFDLSPGTYAYTASCSGKNWSGTITITAGGCQKVQLTSSGGGSTTGQGMFWTNVDHGCGPITVVCNGISRTVTSYYASMPACGASGCANYTFNPGTYSYTASCSGYTWNGSITILSGGCSRIQLQ
jgi:major membrane immunogen (membrane-anchored lipoprotein)